MLTQYRFTLRCDAPSQPRSEWAYRLYAALLEQAPPGFGDAVHRNAVTPLSQFLTVDKYGTPTWTVNLLGNDSERALSGTLDRLRQLKLERGLDLSVQECCRAEMKDVDALFALAKRSCGIHRLVFRTATTFKSQGRYQNLPTTRLVLQSLMKKWNGSIVDCPIDDEDGNGLNALAAGLRCRSFELHDRLFYLKGNSIPGFIGTLTIENCMQGFHRLLADALLLFSGYAGIGIKTTLGMGGVEHL